MLSPSFKSETFTENKEIRRWALMYLSVGEWIMDQSDPVLGSTGFFERKRNN